MKNISFSKKTKWAYCFYRCEDDNYLTGCSTLATLTTAKGHKIKMSLVGAENSQQILDQLVKIDALARRVLNIKKKEPNLKLKKN
jgi:hypothetical protein